MMSPSLKIKDDLTKWHCEIRKKNNDHEIVDKNSIGLCDKLDHINLIK